ncbi:hypothetical protein BYT27DRAFT_6523124 [Phlegmacium glaucopus]|nr:hypothetical protein BYT27DRAFT_6523124 [Phlegmacium glaucopus]
MSVSDSASTRSSLRASTFLNRPHFAPMGPRVRKSRSNLLDTQSQVTSTLDLQEFGGLSAPSRPTSMTPSSPSSSSFLSDRMSLPAVSEEPKTPDAVPIYEEETCSITTNNSNRDSSARVVSVALTPPILVVPPGIKFESTPVPWKALPLEAAQWTFDSQELQSIVARAIQSSDAFIRLLTLENIDSVLPAELERLDTLKAVTQSKYRFLIHRRTMLFQALNSSLVGANYKDEEGGVTVGKLASQLAQTIAECDQLSGELLSISDQTAQINKLMDTHYGSAFAIALRKLHGSLTRRMADLAEAKGKIAQLEIDVKEALKENEKLAKELDDYETELTADDVAGAVIEVAELVPIQSSSPTQSRRPSTPMSPTLLSITAPASPAAHRSSFGSQVVELVPVQSSSPTQSRRSSTPMSPTLLSITAPASPAAHRSSFGSQVVELIPKQPLSPTQNRRSSTQISPTLSITAPSSPMGSSFGSQVAEVVPVQPSSPTQSRRPSTPKSPTLLSITAPPSPAAHRSSFGSQVAEFVPNQPSSPTQSRRFSTPKSPTLLSITALASPVGSSFGSQVAEIVPIQPALPTHSRHSSTPKSPTLLSITTPASPVGSSFGSQVAEIVPIQLALPTHSRRSSTPKSPTLLSITVPANPAAHRPSFGSQLASPPPVIHLKEKENEAEDVPDTVSIRSAHSMQSARGGNFSRTSSVQAAKRRSRRVSQSSLRLSIRHSRKQSSISMKPQQEEQPQVPEVPLHFTDNAMPPMTPYASSTLLLLDHQNPPLRRQGSLDTVCTSLCPPTSAATLAFQGRSADDMYLRSYNANSSEIQLVPRSPVYNFTTPKNETPDLIGHFPSRNNVINNAATSKTIPSMWMNVDAVKSPLVLPSSSRSTPQMPTQSGLLSQTPEPVLMHSKTMKNTYSRLKTLTKRYSATLPIFNTKSSQAIGPASRSRSD